MKQIVLLMGNGDGLLWLIIGIFAAIFFAINVVAAIITHIVKAVREHNGEKMSRRQFWLTYILVVCFGILISGIICGGL